MKRIERMRRFGLVLAYTFMTVWLQAGHGHGHDGARSTHCEAGCGDPNPHYSGHPSPDLGHAPSDCPACQLRSISLILTPTIPALGGTFVAAAPNVEWIRPSSPSLLHHSCRAPPLA